MSKHGPCAPEGSFLSRRERGRAPVGGQGLEDTLLGCEATVTPQSEQKAHDMWGHCLSITVAGMDFSKPIPKPGHYLCGSELCVTPRRAQSDFPAQVGRAPCLRAPALGPRVWPHRPHTAG